MGNSIQTKKKVQTEANSPAHSSSSPRQLKTKGSWPFGRRDKVKPGKTDPEGPPAACLRPAGSTGWPFQSLLIRLESAGSLCCRDTVPPCSLQEMTFEDSFSHNCPSWWAVLRECLLLPAVETLVCLFKVPEATKSSRQTGFKQTRADTDRFSDNLPPRLLMLPLSQVFSFLWVSLCSTSLHSSAFPKEPMLLHLAPPQTSSPFYVRWLPWFPTITQSCTCMQLNESGFLCRYTAGLVSRTKHPQPSALPLNVCVLHNEVGAVSFSRRVATE